MEAFGRWLTRINRKYGDAGAVVSVAFWLIVLFFALRSMLL